MRYRTYCSRCDRLTPNNTVYKKKGKTLILCQRCLAITILEEQGYKLVNRYQPTTKIRGNLQVSMQPVIDDKGYKFVTKFYKDGKYVTHRIYRNHASYEWAKRQYFDFNGEIHEKYKGRVIQPMGRKKKTETLQNKINYSREWNKKNIRTFLLTFNKENDLDIILAFDTAKNKTQFVRDMYRVYKENGY